VGVNAQLPVFNRHARLALWLTARALVADGANPRWCLFALLSSEDQKPY
jgi:hypothetical protein